MKQLRHLIGAVAVLVALTVPAVAQTTLNSTTLAAAVTDPNATQFRLASTSNVSVGDYAVVVTGNVVREIARVTAVNSPVITVTRDAVAFSSERKARKHLSGATVYTGARGRFYSTDVAGACTRAQEQFLPHVSTTTGYVYQCSSAGVWYRLDQQFTVKCFTGALATGSVDQSCWAAEGFYVVTNISEVHKVAESAGTLTLLVKRQQGTEAPASGDALVTAIDMVGAAAVAETVKTATLTTTGTDLLFDAGDRIGLDFTDDVAGELLGVVVTVTLAPY